MDYTINLSTKNASKDLRANNTNKLLQLGYIYIHVLNYFIRQWQIKLMIFHGFRSRLTLHIIILVSICNYNIEISKKHVLQTKNDTVDGRKKTIIDIEDCVSFRAAEISI